MSALVQDAPRPPVVGTITQFLTALPSPLTVSLVSLAPQIRFVRWTLELVSWKGTWDESWLLLAVWWVLCLGSEAILRYLLPISAVTGWWWLTRRAARQAAQPQPATEDTLHRTLSDLTTIQELLPSILSLYTSNTPNPASQAPATPDTSAPPIPLYTTLRVLAFVYPPYLFLTLTGLIHMRTLLGIAGTLAILHRAPFAVLIRRALWRSAYFRWGAYWAWAKISGTPLPGSVRPAQPDISISVASSSKATDTADATQPKPPANAIRFLFTAYENQRWWMGLDWTAALLPSERPSWCSKSLQPCSPPAAFSLPPPTTVYIPDPAESSAGSRRDTRGREKILPKRWRKRTAAWKWDEPEWKVVLRKEGTSATTRVERPLPSLVEEGASASAGKILRAAGKFRGASLDLGSERRLRELEGHAKEGSGGSEGGEKGEKGGEEGQGEEEEEPFTDPDGWVYCDNKWEGGSAKGGMGKYTRYRRWTRVAVLSETVEWVDDADVPADAKLGNRLSIVPQPSPEHAPERSATAPAATHVPETATPSTVAPSPARKATQDSATVSPTYVTHATAEPASATVSDEGSRLKQRLKAVVSGVGH